MAGSLALKWKKQDEVVSGNTLVARTRVRVQSRLAVDPTKYTVHEVLPKILWRNWGGETQELTPLDARRVNRSSATLGALYTSEIWSLAAPRKEAGRTAYRAYAEPSADFSGPLYSANIFLEEQHEGSSFHFDPNVEVNPASVVLRPLGRWERHKRRSWKVRAAKDPDVSIRLLQGEAAREYLAAVESELADAFRINAELASNLPDGAIPYFVETPLSEGSVTANVGPDNPVDLDVLIPVSHGLKGAFAIEVRNLRDLSVAARTELLFFTGIGEDLVMSDLPIALLREEPRDLLFDLVNAEEDVAVLASRRGASFNAVWEQLTAATEELGAFTVGEAALLAATEMGLGATGSALAPVIA
jgi:hypothetical protein